MMLEPSIDKLLDQVDSKYSLVVLEAKRAHELRDKERPTKEFKAVKNTLRALEEIADGTVEIKGIAREAGSRTKIAVYSHDENVDPVGACVGNRGTRVQNIVDELFGEKIDIIVWDEDPAVLISNVLKPAEVEGVYINYVSEKEKMATAVVPEQQLSLAIGREGQNVRLAARVSGWKIDIKSKSQLEDSGFDFDEYEDQDGQAVDMLIDDDVPADAPLDPEAAEVENDVDAEA